MGNSFINIQYKYNPLYFTEHHNNNNNNNINIKKKKKMWTIGVGLRMLTLDSNVAGSIPASICFLLEQETLSALLQSTQL